MLEKRRYAGGYELHFFTDATFETSTKKNPGAHSRIIARNALRILMMGWREDWQQLPLRRLFNAVFIARDRELLKEMRYAFQEGFQHLYQQLQNSHLNKKQHRQVQLYLSNCLSLLPYADITPYESFLIPQWVNSRWQQVEYKVVPIELTPSHGLKTIAIQEQDRVFAYGLEPLFNPQAEPHLIFMGTTYPAGQGFWTQINTDMEAFHTAGASLYQSGRKRILRWLQKQAAKVHVCGVSLGGALSLQLAIDKGEYLSRVDALNPPGLYPYSTSAYDRWDKMTSKPLVIIQQQADDPVSRFGIWKKDWLFIKVTPPKDKKGPNGLADHPLNYAGFAETEFKFHEIEQENIKNRQRNKWLYSVGRAAVYYAVLVPTRYLVRPPLHYLLSHKKTTAVLTSVFLLASLLSLIYLLTAGPATFALALTASLLLLPVTALLLCLAFNGKTKQVSPIPNIHDPTLPRNKEMDVYDSIIERSFNCQELYSYYYVMRCLLKNKPFIPEKETSTSQFKGVSKKHILERSQQKEQANEIIAMRITKAKYWHMNSTLRLIERHGVNICDELINELGKDYQAYQVGKHDH